MQRKEIKSIQFEKEEVKFSLVTNNMILYVGDPEESTKKITIINKFSKVIEYKISIGGTVVLPYTNKEQSNNEI